MSNHPKSGVNTVSSLSAELSFINPSDASGQQIEDAYQLFCTHRENPWQFPLFERSITTIFSLLLTTQQQAHAKGKVIAYVMVSSVLDEAEIEDVCVSTAYRKRGFASALLQALVEKLQEANMRCVHLEVRQSNKAAQALYSRMGFQLCGQRANYYVSEQAVEKDTASKETALVYRLDV
ncbi:ribosomal protein S18-alanine N-acetyltransferase [Ningiella sp. W23]|uniref:ribosomal protein S18-alanine N-acetyltransferase n=1 Tax=Ningiella sp. W23 TaxID=3023715 RepID=UPI0037579C33